LALEFDREDDADRSRWDGATDLLEAVFAGWDLHDADGWRDLLASVAAEGRTPAEATERARQGEPLLATFAASALRAELAAAVEVHRQVPFLLTRPDPEPALAGTIEWLWRDARGSWHLAATVAEPVSGRDPWCGRRDLLTIAAAALEPSLGRPAALHLLRLFDGQQLTTGRSRLRLDDALARMDRHRTDTGLWDDA
jgi:hypothetical protein